VSVATADRYLLDDLESASGLGERDRSALQAVGDWINAFVVRPNAELGREGPVCPFVPGSLERKTFWLVPEQIGDGGVPELVELLDGYKRAFLDTEPRAGDDADYKVFVVVFTDLPADRAQGLFAGALDQLALSSYADDGVIFGPFYVGNDGTALYNAAFRPFQSPVPFVFVRQTVVTDWKFFLEDDAWLGLWARHFGEAGAVALGREVRRLPWRSA